MLFATEDLSNSTFLEAAVEMRRRGLSFARGGVERGTESSSSSGSGSRFRLQTARVSGFKSFQQQETITFGDDGLTCMYSLSTDKYYGSRYHASSVNCRCKIDSALSSCFFLSKEVRCRDVSLLYLRPRSILVFGLRHPFRKFECLKTCGRISIYLRHTENIYVRSLRIMFLLRKYEHNSSTEEQYTIVQTNLQ